jgi:predicted transcriptional regulator
MEVKDMSELIGSAAGTVWKYLNTEGETSVSKLSKATNLETKTLQRAIGWLAKEGKLTIALKGRTEIVALK